MPGMEEIENAFAQTTKLLFGHSLTPIAKYASWLSRHIPSCKEFKTAAGTTIIPNLSIFRSIPEDFMAGLDSEEENAKKRLNLDKTDFRSLAKEFGKAGKMICEFREGTNANVISSNYYLNVQDSFHIAFVFHSKFCAYNVWSSYNEYTFGCYRNMNGQFSINCHFSTEMTRCFEMDACKNCSDSMFCHDCENLRDCIFCFNAKSLRYAICNVEVSREKYMQIRKMLAESLVKELETTGKLSYSIYNLMESR